MDATLLKEEAAVAPGAAPVETHMDIAAVMADLGTAPAPPRAAWRSPPPTQKRRASRHGAACQGRPPEILAANGEDLARGAGAAGRDPPSSTA